MWGEATFEGIAPLGLVEAPSIVLKGVLTITGAVEGTIEIGTSLTSGASVNIGGEMSGVIDVGASIEEGASILVGGSISGQVVVGSDMDGSILAVDHISGGSAQSPRIDIGGEVYCGTIRADANEDGTGDLTGWIEIAGVFNGEICGYDLSAGLLPANINLQNPGIGGTICETVVGDGLSCDGQNPCIGGHVQRYADIDCETSNDCVSNACDYTCIPHLFGDVSPISSVVPPCVSSDYLLIGDGFTNMLDVFCVFNAFNEGSPYTICPCCDVAPTCGTGDGFCNMLDVYAIFETFNGYAPCDDWCACTPCAGGAAARSGGGGERPVESGELLVRFLAETAPIIEENYIEIVEYMVDWLVEHMSNAQRGALADRLEDPSREFASRLAARMTPGIVSALRGE